MNHYITDASIVIQHLVTDTHTANVNALFDELGSTVTLHIPEFCILECANVLWKRVRFHGLPQREAMIQLNNLVGLPLIIAPISGLLAKAMDLGLEYQLAIYDSIYLALADKLQLPLITNDTRQEVAAKAEGMSTKPVTDFVVQ